MFDSFQVFLIGLGCFATLCLILVCFKSYFFRQQQFFARSPITHFESKMFLRLKSAFPRHHVLAQVAFSALITSDNLKVRNKFNRKVTDFVILDSAMDVVAIIELDDPTHLKRAASDRERDAMLNEAGYDVYRYTEVPTIAQLHKDIL